MADRTTAKSIRLLHDAATGLLLTVTVQDGLGHTQATGSLTEVGSSGRYVGTVTPTGDVCEGEWTATFSNADNQTFTVGSTLGASKYDLRALLASRVSDVAYGVVTFAASTQIVDDSLIGVEGDYLKYWMLLEAGTNESGLYRRITDYNGSALTISSAWGADPLIGTRYLLTIVHPQELERVIQSTYQTLGFVGRIPVRAENLVPDDNGSIAIPAGWNYIYDVWARDGTDASSLLTQQTPDTWTMTPGRTITVDSLSSGNRVTLYGTRDALAPVWDDSSNDLDPEVVLALASAHLNIARTSGTALDPEDHMHRQIASFQELETVLRRRAGRPQTNQREVLP